MTSSDNTLERGGIDHAVATTVGIAAKLACSGVFVSGRELADVVTMDIQPLSPLAREVDCRLDVEAGTVVATLRGRSATALYRPGVGATLVIDSSVQALLEQARELPPRAARSAAALLPRGRARDEAALAKAMDAAFDEDAEAPCKHTRALVVLQDGRLLAERYAQGFSRETPILGWSASKSVLGALVGALVTDGRLDLDAPINAPEWRSHDDPRRKITVDQLMRMSSGLSFDEPYVPGSDSTTMLFARGDMASYAASLPLAAEPGRVWLYSSGSTNLLSRALMDAVGGTMAACQDYAWTRLFEPAGMLSAVFEPDTRGVIVGSSYLYATALDWARFGKLHLDDGIAGGRRILSSEWIRYVQAPAPATPGGEYGGHFLRNGVSDPIAQTLKYPDLPADMYFAGGFGFQIVAIFPSHRAVIVRLGWTLSDAFDLNRTFAAILAAIEPSNSAGPG